MIKDELKISFRQIISNKSRSLYIFLITLFLGILTIFLSIISISVKVNGKNIAYDNYEIKNRYYAKFVSTLVDGKRIYLKNNYENILEEIDKYSECIYIYTLYVSKNNQDYGSMLDIELLEKNEYLKIIDKIELDNDKQYIYIEESIASSEGLKAGDLYNYTDFYGDKTQYIIAGIFEYLVNDLNNPSAILDKSILINSKNLTFGSITFDFKRDISIEKVVDANSKLINYFSDNNDKINIYSTYKYYDDVMTFTDIFFYISIAVIIVIILSTILILNNTISVLLDLNKEFLGLMKILGAKKKMIKNIMLYEISFIIFLSLLLSLILFYSSTSFIKYIYSGVIYSIYYYVDSNILNKVSLIAYGYLPIIVVIIVSCLILLLSNKNIKKTLYGNAITMLKKVD